MIVRDAYFSEIYELTKLGEDIVIVSSDLGAPSLDLFRRDFPQRFISVGIAEQNLLSVAAGIALAGKKVIAFGLNPFPVTRAFDQMRNLLNNLQIPITVAALNSGSCSAECGYTHMPIEDFAMVRTLPHVCMVNPSDEIIAKEAAKKLLGKKPVFLRFDKNISGYRYDEEIINFSRGFVTIGLESELSIITSGNIRASVENILPKLKMLGIDVKLIDAYAFPFDKKEFIDEIKNSRYILTIEDNVLSGGLGSLVLEILSDNHLNIPIKRLGLSFGNNLSECFINRDLWYEKLGFNEKQLCETIRKSYLELNKYDNNKKKI